MNYIKTVLLGALVMVPHAQLFAAAGRDVATAVYNCCVGNCEKINCQTGTANAVGDKRNFDVSKVKFIDLGTIGATRPVKFNLPTETEYVGYNVRFAGALSGRLVKFIGTYETSGGKVVYKFYRKLDDEKVWTEVGSMYAAADVEMVEPVISVDGAIISIEPGNKLGIMYVATKALNVPAEVKRPLIRSNL